MPPRKLKMTATNHLNTINVSPSVRDTILENRHIDIVPIIYERFITNLYYEQFWISKGDARKNNIPKNGVTFYDPILRKYAQLSEEEKDSFETLDYITIDPLKDFISLFKAVSTESFKKIYPNEILDIKENVKNLSNKELKIKYLEDNGSCL